MGKLKTVLLTIGCIIVLAILSCRTFLEEIVPVDINDRAIKYAKVDPESFGIIESLADAKRVKVEVVINHRNIQLGLKRASEDDNLAHGDAYGFINNNITAGEQTLDLIIGSGDNPFSIMGLLFSLGIGGGSLAIGRKYLKRPGDFTPQEHEAEVLKVKNGNA